MNDAAFKLKIAELTGSVADAKFALSELQDDLRERDQIIAVLRAALKTKEQTVTVSGFRYVSDDGKAVGLPMCPICVELGEFHRLSSIMGIKVCPKCSAKFQNVDVFPNPNGL